MTLDDAIVKAVQKLISDGFGSILTGAAMYSYITNPKDYATNGSGVVLFLGGILTTVGTIKIVLSHTKLKTNYND